MAVIQLGFRRIMHFEFISKIFLYAVFSTPENISQIPRA